MTARATASCADAVAVAAPTRAGESHAAPANAGAVLFWGKAAAAAPSLWRSQGKGWGGVASASASAVASAVASALASAVAVAPAPSLAQSAGEGWGGVQLLGFGFGFGRCPGSASPGPLPQRRSRRTRPRRGGVHGCTSFFDETGMSRRKIPAAQWTRGAQRRGRGGRACFLLVSFSLHEQRKVTRSPKGSESSGSGLRTCLGSHVRTSRATTTKAKAFAPLRGASAPFFACAKKRGPKKAHPAYAPSALRATGPLHWQDFSTRHPCLVEKRRTSVCVAPFGVLSASSVAAEGNPVEPEQQQEQEQEQQQQQELPLPGPPLRFAQGRGLEQQQPQVQQQPPTQHPHPHHNRPQSLRVATGQPTACPCLPC